MTDRLPARLEASSLIRRAEVEGGTGMIVARGDADSGALVLLVTHRGVHVACLERSFTASGRYEWQRVGPGPGAPPPELAEWTQKRRRFDPDLWLIELDIPHPERFIAETSAIG